VRDTLPSTRRHLNTRKIGCAICSGHLYWIKLVLTGSLGGLVLWWSQSGLFATALSSESVYPWRDPITWPEHWLAVTMNYETIFRWVVLWSLVEHLPQVERCSGLVSQHCVPVQLDPEICIHGLIHYKWPEHCLAFMAKRVFQEGTFWSLIEHLPHAERYSGVVNQHCVLLQLDQEVCIHGLLRHKWLEHWLAFMANKTSLPGVDEPSGPW